MHITRGGLLLSLTTSLSLGASFVGQSSATLSVWLSCCDYDTTTPSQRQTERERDSNLVVSDNTLMLGSWSLNILGLRGQSNFRIGIWIQGIITLLHFFSFVFFWLAGITAQFYLPVGVRGCLCKWYSAVNATRPPAQCRLAERQVSASASEFAVEGIGIFLGGGGGWGRQEVGGGSSSKGAWWILSLLL